MLKMCRRMWPSIMSLVILCLNVSFESATSFDGEGIKVDISQLKTVLRRMRRVRIGRENRRRIRAVLKEDLSNVDSQVVIDLVPIVRKYLSKRLCNSSRNPSEMQLRALAYLSALKNAFESMNFDDAPHRSLTKYLSHEVDQLFEELPERYDVLAIRAPILDALGKGAREITDELLLPCVESELEKLNMFVDQLYTLESKVDTSDIASEAICSKLDVISVDEQTFESSVSVLSSKLDVIDATLDTTQANLGSIESSIDAFTVLTTKADSINDTASVIDTVSSDINEVFETVLSKVVLLDNNIDTISSTISKIDVIASKSSQNDIKSSDILVRLSALLAPDGELDQIESCIEVVQSDIDVVIAVLSP